MGQTEKQKIGKMGEDIACKFLNGRDFNVLERNYLKKFGEIDIIAQKGRILYFIEVKSVSHLPAENSSKSSGKLSRPEDNIHRWKLERLSRTIQTYLLEKKINENVQWQFCVVVVFLDKDSKKAKVRFLENIIL